MTPTPPALADVLLRAFVTPHDFESVSGDLLEEYRESVHPARGQRRADLWYVTQVSGFVVRATGVWAVLFSAAFLVRTALDWLVPPTNFHARSAVSTLVGIGLLTAAGLSASLRSRSIVAGTLGGLIASALAAVLSVVGGAVLLLVCSDAGTMAAVRAAGGVAESFTLPITMMLPGAVLGTLGGVVAAGWSRLRPVLSSR
jgi:hypothetical protein